MACSSKNGNTFVLGLIPWAVNDIVLLLINGTKFTETTLSPKVWLTVCGTISDLTRRLVCTTSTLVFVTLKLPCWNVFVLGLPVHWSCHSFHSVPNGKDDIFVLVKPRANKKLSKPPFKFTTTSGALKVSFHSSKGGVNSILPIQSNIKKGFKFSVLVA